MVAGWRDRPDGLLVGGLLAADGAPGPRLGAGLSPVGQEAGRWCGAQPFAVYGRGWWTAGSVQVDSDHPLSFLLRFAVHQVQPGLSPSSFPLFFPPDGAQSRAASRRRSGGAPVLSPLLFYSKPRTVRSRSR